jgi:3D (Asp-Asp-Asp) domain-containing protein
MKPLKTLFVMALAFIAITVFPLGIISFFATESALTNVVLIDSGVTGEFTVGANTVEEFLHEAGIAVGRHDRISHAQDAFLWDGMTITIEREILFYVQTNGGELIARTSRPGATVDDILRQIQQETEIALIYLGSIDEIENDDILRFDTWLEIHEVELIPLPYETIENRTGAVSRGRQHLRVEGELGEMAITTSIVYIGGVEQTREVISEEILSEPVNAVLDIGTGWLGSLTNTSAPDFHYVQRIRMEATAYTAGFGCTGKHPDDPWYGITASGRRVEHGIVAVDRNVIPLGTRLYVEGYGFAIAADVGSAIRGNKIDLFMHELEDALRFGRRHLYVWILDEI